MIRVYNEVGYHPIGFVSTEMTERDYERRWLGWMRMGIIASRYVRIRVFGFEVIADSADGLKFKRKSGFRFVIGVRRIVRD